MAAGSGVVDRVLRWMRVKGPEVISADPAVNGTVALEGAGTDDTDEPEEERESPCGVEQSALIGFGSVAEDGDLVATKADDAGGIAVAAHKDPPSDSVGGDRYIKTGSRLFRLRADGTLEATSLVLIDLDGGPGGKFVVRQDDTVAPDVQFLNHWHLCAAAGAPSGPPLLGAIPGTPPTLIGTANASSTKVKAG